MHSVSLIKKNMKSSEILALLPHKLEYMPKIATSTQEPTRQYLKAFQEFIKYQAMTITPTDPVLGFLGLVINDSSCIKLSDNQISFIPPANPGKAPPYATGLTATHITEGIRRYNISREEYRTFREF